MHKMQAIKLAWINPFYFNHKGVFSIIEYYWTQYTIWNVMWIFITILLWCTINVFYETIFLKSTWPQLKKYLFIRLLFFPCPAKCTLCWGLFCKTSLDLSQMNALRGSLNRSREIKLNCYGLSYEYYKSQSHTRLIPWLQLRLEESSVANADKTVSFYAKDHLSERFALARRGA